jgi:hypothetical protein
MEIELPFPSPLWGEGWGEGWLLQSPPLFQHLAQQPTPRRPWRMQP